MALDGRRHEHRDAHNGGLPLRSYMSSWLTLEPTDGTPADAPPFRPSYRLMVYVVVFFPLLLAIWPLLAAAPVLGLVCLGYGLSDLWRGRKDKAFFTEHKRWIACAVALPLVFGLSLLLFLPGAGVFMGHIYDMGDEAARFTGGAVLDYVREHEGRLPEAERWCDVLTEDGVDLIRYGARKGQCRFALNVHAGEAQGELPEDLVLLFEAERGWNRTGGPQQAVASDRRGLVRVVRADGRAMQVPHRFLNSLR